MIASSGPVGVVGILPENPNEPFETEQIHLLETFANQTAMAMERVTLAQEAQRERLNAETQSLRNVFLSSVSHDLRTPLATINGAADTLLRKGESLAEEKREELVRTIHGEAKRLNHIVRNVLNMTRLESGAIQVNKDWQSLEEITGVAIERLSERLKDHPLSLTIPANLPLILFDPILMEQVLTNLLENGLQHTPPGTPVELVARMQKAGVLIEIADRGPGIPSGLEERIFEKFTRGKSPGGGVGLGLSICRVIVEAHGGRIWAENRPGGGAVFQFTLPLEGEAVLPSVEKES
jgi:two-component system sensor histidine kinase KdpD